MAKEKYLNKGAYGCVYAPPIACKKHNSAKKNATSNSLVGKLFADKNEFQEEMNAYEKVKQIDPDNLWSLPVVQSCQARITKANPELIKCPHINVSSSKKYMQIILPNGGSTLKEIGEKGAIHMSDFLLYLKKVVDAVYSIDKHGYLHLDIKPQNILVSKEKKVYLIDYSLLRSKDNLYTEDNEYLFKGNYIWYPPEFYIYYKLSKATRQELEASSHIDYISKRSLHVFNEEKYGISKIDRAFYTRQLKYAKEFVRGMGKVLLDNKSSSDVLYSVVDRIDTYSVGITFLNILEAQQQLRIHPYFRQLKTILRQMINANPSKRLTPSKAQARLSKLIKT